MRALRYATLALTTCLILATVTPAEAATTQVGASGLTYASVSVSCVLNPQTGAQAPAIEAGLVAPTRKAKGDVLLNGTTVATLTGTSPSVTVFLADGANKVVVATRRVKDVYTYAVTAGQCSLPDVSGNTFVTDVNGTLLEYAASTKTYATVTPGCAWNPATGTNQPFVNLFLNGSYLINVSVNNVALTQLSPTGRRSVPVFLSAGTNVISGANGSVSIDYYIRDGGSGTCVL